MRISSRDLDPKQKGSGTAKRNKIIWACAAAAVVLVVALVLILRSGSSISAALKSDSPVYDNVVITMEKSVIDLESASQLGEDEEIAVSVYTTTLHKDGDMFYEESDDELYYFFCEDGIRYVIYSDNAYGLGSGDWVKVEADANYLEPAFEFTRLNGIHADMLEEIEGRYVPVDMDTVFFAIVNSDYHDYYKNRYISLDFADDRLTSIIINYVFNGKYQVTEEYTFAYGKASVTIPDVTAVQDEAQ